MPEQIRKMEWEKTSLEKFDTMIQKMPLFHRDIAEQVVVKKAEENAQGRSSKIVEERDIVSAFYSDVPKAFYSLMVRLLDEVGFDHKEFAVKAK